MSHAIRCPNASTEPCEHPACRCHQPAPGEASSEIQESEAIQRKQATKTDHANRIFGFMFVVFAGIFCGFVTAVLRSAVP